MVEKQKPSQVRKRDKEKEREYQKRHKANHPDSARDRKRKQRLPAKLLKLAEKEIDRKVPSIIFHLKREDRGIYGIRFPSNIDKFSPEFIKANSIYNKESSEPLEVEVKYI